MKVNLDNSTDDAQIQILPLIDVIFCILTFFIIAVIQMKQPQAVNVDLPQAKTGTVQAPDRLIITLMSGGQMTVGTEAISDRTALIDRAKTYISQRPDGLLVLNASQNAIYSEVVGVLDALREVGGARRVALATNPKAAPTATPNPYLPNNPYLPSNPNPFPGTNPSGLPNYPNSNPLFPDSAIPGGNPGSIPGAGNPSIPGNNQFGVPPGTGIAPNSPQQPIQIPNSGIQQPNTVPGVQDFNKRTTTIPLTPTQPANR
jgi:biopolymer transport protein ExbD